MKARQPHDGTIVPSLVKASKPSVWMPVIARAAYRAKLAGKVGSNGV